MIKKLHSIIGLPLAAALTILMCGSARSAAAEAIPQQNVAADGSRRSLSAPEMAPTAAGGYWGMKCSDLRKRVSQYFQPPRSTRCLPPHPARSKFSP